MIFAKSNPVESLKEHTELLLERYNILKNLYQDQINILLPVDKIDIFWDMLYDACLYHDCGKVFTPFQNEIRKQLKMSPLKTKFKNNIPHGYLSPAFISSSILQKYNHFKKLLIRAIANHHEREVNVTKEEGFRAIIEDLDNNKNKIYDELGIEIKHLNSKHRNDLIQSNYLRLPEEHQLIYILLKGLRVRIDHSASAHLPVEEEKEDYSNITYKFLIEKYNKIRDVQEFCNNNNKKNLIVIASTGIGKTESALLWANNNKCFYSLPLRSALNSMYDRIRKMGVKSLGLLHSSNLDYLESQNFEDAYDVYENSRMLSYTLNLTTIDQIFGFPFKYKWYEKILATLLYSRIIIDEIQAYSPEITAILLKGIEILHSYGTKFMIMTATLPPVYKSFLEQRGINFECSEFLLDSKRHMVQIKHQDIMEDVEKIAKLSNNAKVLVIVNTVRKSLEIFNMLKSLPYVNINLLHSQFILKHRLTKEKLINRFDKRGKSGIWVTTQIVEASLDIDFDFLFTEMSSLDSLFQRMGRCFRKREFNLNIPNVYVYVENPSGIGTIYDKDIFSLSVTSLWEYNNKVLSENDKVRLIDEVYSIDKIKNTNYYKKFINAINLLDNFMADDLEKKDVQNIIRPISSLTVIPVEYYSKNIILFEKYSTSKSYSDEKLKLLRKIKRLCVDIPVYKIKNKSPIDGLKGIFLVDIEYNTQLGLIHDKEVSNIIG